MTVADLATTPGNYKLAVFLGGKAYELDGYAVRVKVYPNDKDVEEYVILNTSEPFSMKEHPAITDFMNHKIDEAFSSKEKAA